MMVCCENLGYILYRAVLMMLLKQEIIFSLDFICLNSDRYYHRRDLCLKSSNVTLKTAMDIAYNYNVSNGGIQYMICNG